MFYFFHYHLSLSSFFFFSVYIFITLGIHFATLSCGPDEVGRIFPGGAKPETVFRNDVKRVFTTAELKDTYGLDLIALVNHSWRKSALAHLSMGNYCPPSQASMDYRAGHSLDWKKTYYQFMEHADHRVGRIFIGEEGTTAFAQLPAHFVDPSVLVVQEAKLACFPWAVNHSSTFQRCLTRYLAALVYHSEWLIEKYPDHEVHQTPLFQREGMLEALRPLLGDIDGDGLSRTGVPGTAASEFFFELFYFLFCFDFSGTKTTTEKNTNNIFSFSFVLKNLQQCLLNQKILQRLMIYYMVKVLKK